MQRQVPAEQCGWTTRKERVRGEVHATRNVQYSESDPQDNWRDLTQFSRGRSMLHDEGADGATWGMDVEHHQALSCNDLA